MERVIGSVSVLEEGERLDEIGFGGLELIQKPEEFCYGVDAVILGDFASKYAKASSKIAVDLGTGTGIIPFILSHKTKLAKLVGIELQEGSYQRAVRNKEINSLRNDIADRITFINGDVKDVRKTWGTDFAGKVDMVTSNPPYTAGKGGLTSANPAKMIARHETTANLEDFIACASYLLKEKGDFFMVHRPSRIADICCFGRKYRLEPKEICFVSPNVMSKPNILLIHMVKGGGNEVKMLSPLFVYDMEGNYTSELIETYK